MAGGVWKKRRRLGSSVKEKQELPFRYAKMGRWMGKMMVRDEKAAGGFRIAETEIDLLAISRKSKY